MHNPAEAPPEITLGENTMSHQEKTEPLFRPRWLTIHQLMEIVPLKKSRMYHLTHVAAIPHHKIGQTLFFREDEIL